VAHPLDIPIHPPPAPTPPRYTGARDDVRMEAYRRLAAVATATDVDDIRDEWLDRYGAPPPPATALLDVARLRAEAVRLGLRSITVQRGTVRLSGLALRESQKVRLRRLAPKSVAKDDGEVAVPLAAPPDAIASAIVDLLHELIPPDPQPAQSLDDPALASATP
jgi:transcription-repair coupling factor (superfamily II helicase)